MLLLLLLQFVVEGLELGALIRRVRRKYGVDVLTKRDLRAETIHLIIIRASRHAVARHPLAAIRLLLLFTSSWELVEVRSLLD